MEVVVHKADVFDRFADVQLELLNNVGRRLARFNADSVSDFVFCENAFQISAVTGGKAAMLVEKLFFFFFLGRVACCC